MPGRLPNFLIVGAMKSGTTSLAQYLAAHPNAYVPPEGEVHFFEREERWSRGVDWYRGRFAEAGEARAVGEGTAAYMFFTEVPARMASVVPDAKLIAILRDPIERAYSHYLHAYTRTTERRSFGEIVEQELHGGARDVPPISSPGSGQSHYLSRGLYLDQLRRLCEHYDRKRLLVLIFDDLAREPARVFGEVCRFLEIDEAVVPDSVGTSFNPYVEPRSRWLWELMYRRRLWRWLPRRARPAAVRVLARYDPERPPIDADVRARLSVHFAGPNAALGQWLGRDLSFWGDGPTSPAAAPARGSASGTRASP